MDIIRTKVCLILWLGAIKLEKIKRYFYYTILNWLEKIYANYCNDYSIVIKTIHKGVNENDNKYNRMYYNLEDCCGFHHNCDDFVLVIILSLFMDFLSFLSNFFYFFFQ